MIVVLTIIAVAAGMIAPRMSGSVQRGELREAAARLAGTARAARELAVSTRRLCGIEIDLGRGAYCPMMQSSEVPGGKMEPVQASWLQRGRWPETIRVADYRTPRATGTHARVETIEFFPDGTSSGAMIRLADDTRAYCVVVHAHSGRVVYGDAQAMSILADEYDLGD